MNQMLFFISLMMIMVGVLYTAVAVIVYSYEGVVDPLATCIAALATLFGVIGIHQHSREGLNHIHSSSHTKDAERSQKIHG